MTRPPLFEGVQVLRFVAALLVVVTHATFYARERLDGSIAVWDGGTAGVDVFFVVSGFVMAVTAGPFEVRGGWRFFAVRRVIRIVPLYWIATTLKIASILVLPGAVLHAALTPWSGVASYLFLPSRNPDGAVEPLLGVGWTLTFEAAFYAVFALGLLLRRNVLVFASAIVLLVASGHAFRPAEDWPTWAVYFDPIVLYFAIGMAIGRIVALPNARRALLVALGLAAAIAVVASVTPGGVSWQRDALFRKGVVTAAFIAVVLAEPLLRRLARRPGADRVVRRPLLALGDASYSLYLFHPMIGPAVPAVLALVGLRSGVLSVAGTIAVSLVAATLIHRLVERPITRRLRGLPYAGLPPDGWERRSARAEGAVDRGRERPRRSRRRDLNP
ncbi:acyltransferase family protein [Rathayibacter sp. VKM Ac-2804]|uniref:acyltransferase family protein n=1 Tax=Rathayibacter sp. VKM Ac-2804 TaxID=2609257 RepID=UPI00132EE0AB|nr:acyltransferase [Rathayibacter sp. VKM Ac-2804]QHF23623.1 acyltransferase family protein [Rathayibacter sp. VKM Ac-2804]